MCGNVESECGGCGLVRFFAMVALKSENGLLRPNANCFS